MAFCTSARTGLAAAGCSATAATRLRAIPTSLRALVTRSASQGSVAFRYNLGLDSSRSRLSPSARRIAVTTRRTCRGVTAWPASPSASRSQALRLCRASAQSGPEATAPGIAPRFTRSWTPGGSTRTSSRRRLTHERLRPSWRAISSSPRPSARASSSISQPSSSMLRRPRRSRSLNARAAAAAIGHTAASTVSWQSRLAALTPAKPSTTTSRSPSLATTTADISPPLIAPTARVSSRASRATSPSYRRSSRVSSACMASRCAPPGLLTSPAQDMSRRSVPPPRAQSRSRYGFHASARHATFLAPWPTLSQPSRQKPAPGLHFPHQPGA